MYASYPDLISTVDNDDRYSAHVLDQQELAVIPVQLFGLEKGGSVGPDGTILLVAVEESGSACCFSEEAW